MNDTTIIRRQSLNQLRSAVSELNQTLLQKEEVIEEQTRKLVSLQTENEKLASEIEFYREQIQLAKHRQFAKSSEKAPLQEDLFNEAEWAVGQTTSEERDESEDQAVDETVSTATRIRPKRKPIPDHYPRVKVVHDLAEHEKVCPHDGATLECIGEDISEQLDIVPATVRVLQHIKKKYACPCCDKGLVTASMPPQPIPKSLASPNLLAMIIAAKYVDSTPLYRQEKGMAARLGVDLPRNTAASWMIKIGQDLCAPLVERLRHYLVNQPYLHMDDTVTQVLNEPGRAATTKSYMWVVRGGPPGQEAILFHYDPHRNSEVPLRLLKGFRGVLQGDGYDGYNDAVKTYQLIRIGCMAHARRKFYEALVAADAKKAGSAQMAMSFIKKLYVIEREIENASIDERHRTRQEQSVPLLGKFKTWLDDAVLRVTPKSLLGKAIRYALNEWDYLIGYCRDGRLRIDNNLAENAIRPFVIGRKNFLFSDTPDGATASANLYSLVETAKANGLEPYAYFCHLMQELPKAKTHAELDALLPWNAKAALAVKK